MNELHDLDEVASPPRTLPPGVVLDDKPPFVPRMVMTPQLTAVLRDVVAQWKHRDKFAGLTPFGIRPLDRLLFYGPPGNGKTLACYWVGKQLGVPVYRVLCNQLHGNCLGDTTRAVAKAVKFLDSQPEPGICLWDEIESIFVDRRQSQGQCDREVAAALTVFLQALDRWKSPMLLVMATNLPEQLDAALLSRVALKLEFLGPNADQCGKLLDYWCELLAKFGSEEWGPRVREAITATPPESFRELQQVIGYSAREWVARQCS